MLQSRRSNLIMKTSLSILDFDDAEVPSHPTYGMLVNKTIVQFFSYVARKNLPYSKKLTRNDFNAKVINAEEINAVEELLLYFFNKINAVSTSGFQII